MTGKQSDDHDGGDLWTRIELVLMEDDVEITPQGMQ